MLVFFFLGGGGNWFLVCSISIVFFTSGESVHDMILVSPHQEKSGGRGGGGCKYCQHDILLFLLLWSSGFVKIEFEEPSIYAILGALR